MNGMDGDMPIDIQINEDPLPKASNLVEEKPNENQKEVNEINKNDKSKIDETNFPIGENNKGLFSQFQEDEKNNETTIESNRMTLDEPVLDSLKRDLFRIYNKLKHVITPRLTSRKIEELYNWDLWGPLLFCFLYSMALSNSNNNTETSIFVLVFVIFWIGGFVITFNEKFLGAQIGICQVLSLLGYGMFPITVAGIIIGFCGITNIFVKLILVLIGLIWSIVASLGFFSRMVEPDKKLLAIFPVFIFLFSLSMFSLNY